LYLFDYYRRMELRKVTHENHYDVEAKFPVFENETWHDVWAVIYCSHENSKKLQVATSESPTHNPGGHIQDLSPVMETANTTLKEDNMSFTFSSNEATDYPALGMCEVCGIRFTQGCEHSNTDEAQEWLAAHIVAEQTISITDEDANDISNLIAAALAEVPQFEDAFCDPRTPEQRAAYADWKDEQYTIADIMAGR